MNALHPREMDFEQQYDLEFYQGSNYVGTSGFPVEMNNQTEFTIISQTSSVYVLCLINSVGAIILFTDVNRSLARVFLIEIIKTVDRFVLSFSLPREK